MKKYMLTLATMNAGAKDVLYKIRYLFIPYITLLCACLVIKLLFTRTEIFFAVNGIHSDFADAIEPYITHIGDGFTVITLSLIFALFNYRASFLMITSYALTALTAQILKFSFDMPRPRVYFEDQLDKIHFVKGLYILAVHSFPSGHTVTAFSAGVVITYLAKNKSWGLLLFFVAVMVGYSRMYLSQHFFEDVTVGSVVGVFITLAWLTFIDRKKFINSPRWDRGLLTKS
ncbi:MULTISPECIES: phosphatase PAP2 family protein [unclassified Mucilaginibacter]|uniref:phosphatase PAP2 family protein n=2 Tax=Mucilaginibacter TaxID=423349 RepID=UPI002AC9E882|nr:MULTISPECIES: phosphatase PAP2 family protein [unclassified Mucilaginibacter]MEB0280442.1 phosphatase PAP2 family protein [Mucilaginibacter sp. 10B2]MEB0300448.1 phosphatase PAP2 family protein [Mucilaginibacter sp. 5C4]WPX23117.1 phosphatase PAP2 family protein [Mucilaginibacter sp. 5C4]